MTEDAVKPAPAALTDVEARAEEAGATRDDAITEGARKRHGVVHTPRALARFTLARADAMLRSFGHPAGVASEGLTVLDPACGPGVFLASALALAGARGGAPRLLGLDRDRQALRTALEVLQPAARAAGWKLTLKRENTLNSLDAAATDGAIAVVGNPPWVAGRGARSELSDTLLDDFRLDHEGAPLGERKVGVLSDAYVRFWRWAAEAVRQAPRGGVIAFVTNASFLDGPVHRGMRAALLRWFERVEVFDLGGNAMVAKERGVRDENLFGVRPGVAVVVAGRGPFFVESKVSTRTEIAGGAPAPSYGVVHALRIRGPRADKLASLAAWSNDPGAAPLREIAPAAPEMRLTPLRGGSESASAWPKGWAALDILFPFHQEGVQTNRDAVVIDADRDRLLRRLHAFALGLRLPELEPAWKVSRHYDPNAACRDVAAVLAADPEGHAFVRKIAYRPFDTRYFAALPALCHRPRPKLLEAMDYSAHALLTVKKDRGERPWAHVAASDCVSDSSYLSARSSCRTRVFPTHGPDGNPNLSDRGERWTRMVGASSGELLDYALTFLVAPAYQARFEGLLPTAFPRIPPPTPSTFAPLAAAGAALRQAFLGSVRANSPTLPIGHWDLQVPDALRVARARADQLVASLLGA